MVVSQTIVCETAWNDLPDPGQGCHKTRARNHRLTGNIPEGLYDNPSMSLVGYARVSTIDQNPALQHDALDGAGCTRIFTDTASGALDQRPQLSAALDYLRPGDVLVVWRLDRLGRSVRHLTETVNTLAERGIGFRSLTEGIDTTTPAGKLVFHIFASLAEFEREIIRERTNAGLAAARARGRTGGRRPKMTPGKLATARQLYDGRAHTVAQIAEIVGVSRATLYRHLEANAQPAATR
jgi:DNA invertase Pin-like site-specific DNA recombinase